MVQTPCDWWISWITGVRRGMDRQNHSGGSEIRHVAAFPQMGFKVVPTMKGKASRAGGQRALIGFR